jgi:predicted phosphoribosyltransferase
MIVDLPELRERRAVFRDRAHAGELLGELLARGGVEGSLVLAVPAGGVPVGAAVARRLGLPLDLAVVSKITPPWNSEVGYGAVAFDGTVRLNAPLVRAFALGEDEIQEGIRRTREKVTRRVARFRGDRPLPDLGGRTILVDDGLASGFTIRVAAEAVRRAGGRAVVIAVPTGHADSARALAREVDAVYCANLRSGPSFAVAEAYEYWSDLGDDQVAACLDGGG